MYLEWYHNEVILSFETSDLFCWVSDFQIILQGGWWKLKQILEWYISLIENYSFNLMASINNFIRNTCLLRLHTVTICYYINRCINSLWTKPNVLIRFCNRFADKQQTTFFRIARNPQSNEWNRYVWVTILFSNQ